MIEAREKVPADIEVGDWRLDLVPNEQALHNVLTSIREVAAAEDTHMHKLIVQNPLAKSMSSKKCDELVSSETQKYVYEAARNVSNAVMCLQQLYSKTCGLSMC